MCTINHLILYIPKVNQNMNLIFLSFSYKYEIHLNNNSAVRNNFFFLFPSSTISVIYCCGHLHNCMYKTKTK